jgi:hypothetical protein
MRPALFAILLGLPLVSSAEPGQAPPRAVLAPRPLGAALRVRALALAPALEPPRALPFGAGESMTFSLRLAGIEGGRGALSVGAPRREKGRRTLKLRGLTESVPFISAFRKLREEVVTQIDLAGLHPLHHTSDRELASRRRKIVVRYEPTRLLQTIERDGQLFRRERVVAAPVFDGASVLFALRAAALPTGARLSLRVVGGPHLYGVTLTVTGPERVLALGRLRDAIRLDGIAQEIDDRGQAVKGERPRRFSLWLGADPLRLPLRAVGDTKLGQAEASLTSFTPARRPLVGRPPRLGSR